MIEMIEKAEQRDPEAMRELAEAYYLGNGIEQDDEKAFSLFEKLEELFPDDDHVWFRLGQCHMFGYGTQINYELAKDYFQKCVDLDASQAMVFLGDLYLDGKGVDKDQRKAYELYIRATNLGNPDAYYSLGMMQYFGKGIPVDKNAAISNWMKAAEMNHPQAVGNMAIAYRGGDCVEKSFDEMMKWGKKAVELGVFEESELYVWACKYFYANEKSYESSEKASAYYDKAAEMGNPDGALCSMTTHDLLAMISQTEALGDWEEALKHWKIAGQRADALSTGTMMYGEKSVSQEAYELASKSARFNHFHQAYCYARMKDYQTARELMTGAKGFQELLLYANILLLGYTDDNSMTEAEGILDELFVNQVMKGKYNLTGSESSEADYLLCFSALAQSVVYRTGGIRKRKPDLEKAIQTLDFASTRVNEEQFKNILIAERSKYVKKMFGYKYMG